MLEIQAFFLRLLKHLLILKFVEASYEWGQARSYFTNVAFWVLHRCSLATRIFRTKQPELIIGSESLALKVSIRLLSSKLYQELSVLYAIQCWRRQHLVWLMREVFRSKVRNQFSVSLNDGLSWSQVNFDKCLLWNLEQFFLLFSVLALKLSWNGFCWWIHCLHHHKNSIFYE